MSVAGASPSPGLNPSKSPDSPSWCKHIVTLTACGTGWETYILLIIAFLWGQIHWSRNPKLFQKTNNQAKLWGRERTCAGHKSLKEGHRKFSSFCPGSRHRQLWGLQSWFLSFSWAFSILRVALTSSLILRRQKFWEHCIIKTLNIINQLFFSILKWNLTLLSCSELQPESAEYLLSSAWDM